MSAIVDNGDKPEIVKTLFVLHPGFDLVDFAGPYEIFQNASHPNGDESIKAFECYTAGEGAGGLVKSSQGAQIKVDMDFEDAEADLEEFDILVVVGGSTDAIVNSKPDVQPIPLIKAYAAHQTKDPSKERTLFSICTGALFLAKAGVLQGMSATTHPEYYTKLEIVSQTAAQNDTGILTDVQEERYVVNNARFELGDLEDNPFVFRKQPNHVSAATKKARRGSEAFKQARRRESLVKRSELPLGGLRVITSGGVTAGMDAALYLVAAHVDIAGAEKVAKGMQFQWQKGVCVEAIDV